MEMQSLREFDVVVFGATGYTGMLISECLARNYSRIKHLRWGLSGRSLKKLEEIKRKVQSIEPNFDFGLIVANVTELESIETLVRRTRLVLTSVGPYNLHGEIMVASCVKHQTHYMDITGEPQFIDRIVDKYHQKAQDNRVFIITSCGFDSVPDEIGLLNTLKEAKNQKPHCIESFMLAPSTGDFIDRASFNMSSGTWKATLTLLKNLVFLIDANQGSWFSRIISSLPYYHSVLKKWVMPFPSSNQYIVLRAYQMMRERAAQCGQSIDLPRFYRSHIILRSFGHLLSIGCLFVLFIICVRIPGLSTLLFNRKVEGSGPSSSERSAEGTSVEFISRGLTSKTPICHTKLSFGEIYSVTPIFAVHTLLCFLKKLDLYKKEQENVREREAEREGERKRERESTDLEKEEFWGLKGGVVSPGFLVGNELLKELKEDANLTFSTKYVIGL